MVSHGVFMSQVSTVGPFSNGDQDPNPRRHMDDCTLLYLLYPYTDEPGWDPPSDIMAVS